MTRSLAPAAQTSRFRWWASRGLASYAANQPPSPEIARSPAVRQHLQQMRGSW
ncbi:hypothetical protein MYCTH_2296685 [Thermothelomyces thermophilus ATCC 42464]|uniref:Uncharacterized protein n=1 Tax=Thermothelomyces thermophilus (strain ATCC 42464 / BCRC 31852 / DSM 1799) TaxID=573729 RepID=G2Q2F3_THET4|nr:uncharacterized protein MYCTH_2296685 [Thermothelomyces thermophilus ATCC 42464]AEO54278.1 hypothetical protein MYCTH_2296685 [Thermothelomyces thermophilus ATCC 42464]